MTYRHREFAQIRSLAGSRCISQTSQTISVIDKLTLQTSRQQNRDCIGCFNKNMAKSKKQEEIRKKQQDNKYYVDNLKKIKAAKDHQKQQRQKMLIQASEFNKSLAASQRESAKKLKRVESQQVMQQIKKKQQEFDQAESSFKESRIELKDKYKDELQNQLYSQRSMKQSQLTQSRVIDKLSLTTNLKLIEESEQHHNKMKEEHKKCQQLNKSLILQKSYRKMEEREENKQKEKEHISRVEEEFTKFTEFQGSNNSSQLNKSSLSISSSSRTLNPEDVFTQLKRIQTKKKLSKIEERNQKHTKRMMELKKLQEERKVKMQNKISSMRSYGLQLANQVFEKKEQRTKQRQQGLCMPKKSRVDYYTEQAAKTHGPCGSCSRVVQKKFINI